MSALASWIGEHCGKSAAIAARSGWLSSTTSPRIRTLRPRELRLAVETARLNAMEATTIGIIGCGNISAAYLGGAARSRLVRVKSVADIRAEAAKTKAAELAAAGYVCGYSACRSGN